MGSVGQPLQAIRGFRRVNLSASCMGVFPAGSASLSIVPGYLEFSALSSQQTELTPPKPWILRNAPGHSCSG